MIKSLRVPLLALSMMLLMGASSDNRSDFLVKSPSEFTLTHELLDKNTAIFVLGGIDYYVENCTELTPLGVEYRNYIISYHDINVGLLSITPLYIEGAFAISMFTCNEMYEMVTTLDSNNLVMKPKDY
jgi:hypothetical protein